MWLFRRASSALLLLPRAARPKSPRAAKTDPARDGIGVGPSRKHPSRAHLVIYTTGKPYCKFSGPRGQRSRERFLDFQHAARRSACPQSPCWTRTITPKRGQPAGQPTDSRAAGRAPGPLGRSRRPVSRPARQRPGNPAAISRTSGHRASIAPWGPGSRRSPGLCAFGSGVRIPV